MSYTDDRDLSFQLGYMTNELKLNIGKLERPDIDFEIKKCKKTIGNNLVSNNMNAISSMITFFEQYGIILIFKMFAQ